MGFPQVQGKTGRLWLDVLIALVVIPVASVVGVSLATGLVGVTKGSAVARAGGATVTPVKGAADPSVCCCDDSACTKNCEKYQDGTCGERGKYPCKDRDCK